MPKKGGDHDKQARMREALERQRKQQAARADRLAAAQQRLGEQQALSQTPYIVEIHPSSLSVPSDALTAYVDMNRQIAIENQRRGATDHAEHIANSRQQILATADVALARVPAEKKERKKALVLGAGNCTDIPLTELAQRFDQVTLVELDRESAERAIKRLPEDLQRKVRLIVADVTGVAGNYLTRLNQALARATADKSVLVNTAIGQFASDAAQITEEVNVSVPAQTPDFGDDYTFVCSQLVMSQLANLPRTSIGKSFERAVPGFHLSTAPGGLDTDFFMNFQYLSRALVTEHLRLLRHSVAQEGTVHFADTYARLLPNPARRGQEDVLPMVLPQIINPTMDELFVPLHEPVDWFWNHTPGSQRFYVIANALEPKPAIATN